MQFRMLGPFEAADSAGPIKFGGTKQRATLGFLLLKANRVVSTSQLVTALWDEDDTPASARQILHNAIWSLRVLLSGNGHDSDSVALLTQAPGYTLQVDPEQVDLFRFHKLAEQGRAELAGGSSEQACRSLREALALWRGHVLADLVETGVAWPELTVVQSARLDAIEDYFEAELAAGHHQAMIGELEAVSGTETLRERSCGQLMLALYRCGRQEDALNAYRQMRSTLIKDLGLEPGRQLQLLQQAILRHDSTLTLAQAPPQESPGIDINSERIGRQNVPEPPPLNGDDVGRAELLWQHAPPDKPRIPEAARTPVSVLLVRAGPAPGPGGMEPGGDDEVTERVSARTKNIVEHHGGTIIASICSVSLALFDATLHGAERAVHAALTVCGHEGRPAIVDLSAQAAITTGEALVRYRSNGAGGPISATGALLDTCQKMLENVPAGQIHVCDSTYEATESIIAYRRPNCASTGWQALGTHGAAHDSGPVVGREWELDLLRGLLDRAWHRAMPHMVTVLGEPGVGKTRFILEFQRRVGSGPDAIAQFVTADTPSRADGEASGLAVHTALLASYCGISAVDTPAVAWDKLAIALHRLPFTDYEAERLLTRLRPLVISDRDAGPAIAMRDVLPAWTKFLRALTLNGPLVVVVDQLHRADDHSLDIVENLAESCGDVPLLVVVAAQAELLRRRPGWNAGGPHTATITLDPISDAGIDRQIALAR